MTTQKYFIALLSERNLTFEEADVARDGNCGFHALGITRERAVEQLREAARDEETRALVAQEIKAGFINDDLPAAMKDEAYGRLHARSLMHILDQLNQEITNYCQSEFVYMSYIEHYLNRPIA